MLLTIIQDPIEAALVGTFSLTLGLFLLVLGFIFIYLKKQV
jgi:hypothetical protein